MRENQQQPWDLFLLGVNASVLLLTMPMIISTAAGQHHNKDELMQSQGVNVLVLLGCLVGQACFSSESKNSFVHRLGIASVLLALVADVQLLYAFTEAQVASDDFPALRLDPTLKLMSGYRHLSMVIAEVPLQMGLSMLNGYLSSRKDDGYKAILSHDKYWMLSAVNAIFAASKVQKGVIGHTTHLPAMLLRLVDSLVTNSSCIKNSITHFRQATQGAVANGLVTFGNGFVATGKPLSRYILQSVCCRGRQVSANDNESARTLRSSS